MDSEPDLSARALVLSTLAGWGLGRRQKCQFEPSGKSVNSRMVLTVAPGGYSARGSVYREWLMSRARMAGGHHHPAAQKPWALWCGEQGSTCKEALRLLSTGGHIYQHHLCTLGTMSRDTKKQKAWFLIHKAGHMITLRNQPHATQRQVSWQVL